ncbi:DUF885 domain-containing protein [soil metagenome]
MQMIKRLLPVATCMVILLMAACDNKPDVPKGPTLEEIAAESARLNIWFDRVWDDQVSRYPVWKAYLAIKDSTYGQWGDFSDSMQVMEFEILKKNLAFVKDSIDFNKLDEKTQTSYRMWVTDAEEEVAHFDFRFHNYPIDQMNGVHTWLPSFLINIHQIESLQDAKDYISRLQKIDKVMEQVVTNIKLREQKDIVLPKFLFPAVLKDCKNLLSGAPFDKSKNDSPLFADLKGKVEGMDSTVDAATKTALIEEGRLALLEHFKPAYDNLVAYLTELEKKATNDAGVWKFPNGDTYYEIALANSTTTKLTPDEVMAIGQSEIARIHGEMYKIMKQVNFEGDSLKDFFKFIKEGKQFYNDNTPEGKQKYLTQTQGVIDSMRATLPKLFTIFPKAALEVKQVEPFREASAGTAFYEGPAPDGSRPGRYYVNLYEMKNMPWYEMEALAYHEAIPGHHMQISINQELDSLPKFRTLGGDYTAYVEGWGLYSEYIPKEYGFYKDPYSDFGRLSMELWRACRLVVDVGIHWKRWSREEGIEFYVNNTPSPLGECVGMVERHIVMPGQATAYKIGQMKILDLLNKSRQELGDKFDIKGFHDEVLRHGSLPLNILEENIHKWIAKQKDTKAAA